MKFWLKLSAILYEMNGRYMSEIHNSLSNVSTYWTELKSVQVYVKHFSTRFHLTVSNYGNYLPKFGAFETGSTVAYIAFGSKFSAMFVIIFVTRYAGCR